MGVVGLSTHDGAHDTARACVDGTIGVRTTRSAALGRHDDPLAARRSLGVAGVGSCEFLQCTVPGKHGAVSDDATLRVRDVIFFSS